MGAGSIAAGLGPAGVGLVTVSPPVPPPDVRGAALFDPETRSYLFGDNDALLTEHPIWQRAVIALTMRRGSLPSAPSVGIALDRLRRATNLTAQKEAEYAARVALADLIAEQSVELVAVRVVLPWDGLFIVDVRNLREAGAAARPISVRP